MFDFFEEEVGGEEKKKLAQTVTKKRGGPYSKQDRFKRRNEVFKLHFDYGYSARKIAEMMNINHHTICSDVNYWYGKLHTESKNSKIDEWQYRYEARLESQRTRLREHLEKAEGLEKKLAVERLILDIDEKLAQTNLRIATGHRKMTESLADTMNRYLKATESSQRVVNPFDIIHLPVKAGNKVRKIIEQERQTTKF